MSKDNKEIAQSSILLIIVIKGIKMFFSKILLWLVIPFVYFILFAIYFVEFKKIDLAAFNSLKNINTQIFYYSAIGGLIFAYTCKPIIKKLKQKEMAYADGVVDYLIMIMVFLSMIVVISAIWRVIFLMSNV